MATEMQDDKYNLYSEENMYKGRFYISVKDENYLETGVSSVPNNNSAAYLYPTI